MNDGAAELQSLIERVRRLEDERDIARLIASYGPAVDAADAAAAAGLWTDDGTYDVEGWQMNSRAEVHRMVSSSAHAELVASGCSHFLGPAVVTVDGDTAVAVCESLVLLRRREPLLHNDIGHQGGAAGRQEYRVWRAAANLFELIRTAHGWRITRRTSRLLDGGAAGQRLLVQGLSGESASGFEHSQRQE
ncbi:nuclear transport factor 2 family protein [Mycolicibacterium sp.]|uniref:nuclear transport factor 2 family protein n=1 Tax=Mycolicibacterium sp. TaxID=2320850 RepID=UPI003D0EDFAE